MPEARFDTYFHNRSQQFSSFYRSESIARALGRGALFERLRFAVTTAVGLQASRVLDVGCGSGPLFAPLAVPGISVTGIEPAQNMYDLAVAEARRVGPLVSVEKRGWETLNPQDAHDLAVALGVFDYVDDADALLSRLGACAPHVVASFPTPGVRTNLRKFRYGRKGVRVTGTTAAGLVALGTRVGMRVEDLQPLGRAGYAVRFSH